MDTKSDKRRLKRAKIQCAHMEENIDHCIQLCANMVKKFHPLLGIQTTGIVKLCEATKELDFYSAQDYKTLTTSAHLIHIGCISLPRPVLTNYKEDPSSLTAEDWVQIHMEPVYAEELVRGLVGELKHVSESLRSVRENWDGSGYPDGKARENIPLPARFLRLAAYYVESEASPEDTMLFIQENSGKLFHPESVRLFYKVTQADKLPEKVMEILFSQLRAGMKLAHPLNTPGGLLMCPEETVLNEFSLEKIVKYNERDPITDRIIVYR